MQRLFKLLLILSVLALAIPALAQTATEAATDDGQTTIAIGDTITGELTSSQPSATYHLNAEAGQTVTIILSSDDFDAYITLLDGNGHSLAENDDVNGTNAGFQNFVLPAASSYSILAESYGNHEDSGAETGAYTLSVIEPHIEHLEYTQSVQGTLTATEGSKDYLFSGQAGDVIVATESSTDSSFDAYLHLLDSTGTELTNNDDAGGSLNAMIGPYTLPSTGSYTLRATTIDETTAGSFTLTLNKTEITPLAYDEPLEVDFTPNHSAQYFTFAGSAGDLVSIEADSKQTIDTTLTLNDSNNSQIATDADGGSGFDPEIYQQLLTTTGTYTVMLQAATPGTGKVSLSLTRTAPPSLDEGPQTLNFTDSNTARAVSFTGKAGDSIRLNLHLSAGDSGSPSVTVTQGDTTLASASGSTISDLNFSFPVTSDGPVVVQITDYSYSTLSYEVTLAHASE
ncbi:MAG: pre-peptidase C-terminal domain-containing protein [Chloroflexota bacterium]